METEDIGIVPMVPVMSPERDTILQMMTIQGLNVRLIIMERLLDSPLLLVPRLVRPTLHHLRGQDTISRAQ